MIKRVHRLVVLLLGSVLGLASCPFFVAEYGVPHATYKVDGKVVAASNDAPLAGISVSFGEGVATDAAVGAERAVGFNPLSAAVFSDANGDWKIEVSAFPDQAYAVLASDVDDAGSAYRDTLVALAPQHTQEGSGSWDNGVYEQHGVQIEMEPR